MKNKNQMTSKVICLKKVPEKFYETEKYYIGINFDMVFDIFHGNENIGCIYVSDYGNAKFIEWAVIYPDFSGKGFYRDVLLKLMEVLDVEFLSMESSDSYLAMYQHFGAELESYDEDREMTSLTIRKEVLLGNN